MKLSIALGVYFITWWIVFFAVLPFGVTSQHETDQIVPGSEPGAPVAPMLLKKAIWTTFIASIVFGVVYAVIANRGIEI